MAKSDRLLENFASEYVQIILDKEIKTSKSTATKVETSEIPLTVEGYLTDADDDMLYLGFTQNTISQSVQRKYIIHLQVVDENSAIDDLILSGEIPENEGSWN